MDTSVTDHLYEDRLAKLNKIKELGIDLYPLRFEKISVSEAREKKIDNKVKVAGRIMAIRGHGGLVFMDLEDGSEKIQLAFKKDVLGDSKLIPLLDLGDFIGIEGTLFKTQAGELTILVEKMTLLSKIGRASCRERV